MTFSIVSPLISFRKIQLYFFMKNIRIAVAPNSSLTIENREVQDRNALRLHVPESVPQAYC